MMIFFILIFVFFFMIDTFLTANTIMGPKKLYKITYGYTMPSDFTIIRARTVEKAVRKFERKNSLVRIYKVERMEEF